MRLFKTDFNRENMALLSCLVLASIAMLIYTNLRFQHFDLFPYVRPGIVAHYYVNYYDFSFVKRGLVASLIRTTGMYPGVNTVHYTGFFIGIAACCAASYGIFKMKNNFGYWSYLLLAALMVFNPGTFANMGFDLGRFDQLLIICSLLSFYYIRQGALLKVMIISAIALLIHELYIILFFPILFYTLVSHSNFSLRQIGFLLVVIGLVLGALFFFGEIENKNYKEVGETITVDGLYFGNYGIIWTRTLEANMAYTGKFLSGLPSGQIIRIIYGGTYTLLIFALLIMISLFNKMDWYGYLIILLTSAVIFFLAIDYSRWYSLMIVNGFLYFGFCSFSAKERQQDKLILTKQHLIVTALLLIIGFILGPIGVIRSFPFFNFL